MKNKQILKELLGSYKTTDVILAAFRIDLFKIIEQLSPTTEELVSDLQIKNPIAFSEFLKTLQTLKLITEYDGKWTNMPLIRDNLASLEDLLQSIELERKHWQDLDKFLMKEQVNPVDLDSYDQDETDWNKISDFFPASVTEDQVIIIRNFPFAEFPHQNCSAIILDQCLHQFGADTFLSVLKTVTEQLDDNTFLVIIEPLTKESLNQDSFRQLSFLLKGYEQLEIHTLEEELISSGLWISSPFLLENGNTILFAAKSKALLKTLHLTEEEQLKNRLLSIGFDEILPIDPSEIVTAPFTHYLCDYGCRSGSDPRYKKKCVHHSKTDHNQTRRLLDSYQKAFLLCGEPPTDSFQKKVLLAQAEAFKSGYYKAFAYWAGPCSLCKDCEKTETCLNPQSKRPSMEGAGIDVFKTVENIGRPIKTLRYKGEYIHYFGLLLLK